MHENSDRPLQGSPQWLAERRTGIGGSEISALYKLPDGSCAHPWLSPVRLWAIKTGRLPDEQLDPWQAPQLYVGKMLEQPVREMYSLYSARTVEPGVTLLRDAEAPVLLASTDGTQTCSSRPGEPGVYEGKVTTVFRRLDWVERVEDLETGDVQHREIVPLHYVCQTQHYMACTGNRWASVVAFIQADRTPIHWRDIERDETFISDVRERADRWWRDHVIADVQPTIDDSPATEAALRSIHREAQDIAVQLPAAFAAALDRMDALNLFAGIIKRERQRLRNMVLSAMGPAMLAVIADDGRGWALRGASGRALRSLARSGVERARRNAGSMRPVYVPADLGAQLDELYRLNAMTLRADSVLSAKAVHIAHIAAEAAAKITK